MGILRGIFNKLGLTNSAKFERLIAEDRASSPEEYRFADEILTAFHSGGGLAPRMQAYKLVSLNRLLEAEKPRSILELGSGSSTVVFARYATRNNASFVTVDESQEWLENTLSMLTTFGVRDAVTSYVRKKRIDVSLNTASYIDLPTTSADFVLIDGPALEENGTKHIHAVCTDVLEMIPDPKTIIIDIRKPTVERLEKETNTGLYAVSRSDILQRSPKPKFNYFSKFSKS